MSVNGIHMQKGLSLPQFIQLYGTEQQCEAALQKARWAQGPKCHGQNACTVQNKDIVAITHIEVSEDLMLVTYQDN
ncbi:MAG: hypothetical protein RL571_2512 [Pseudomonadota bacterium]|jgi:hypothetical protein